ncbi:MULTISPECIES: DUF1365 domain-containing protein [unclassified Roseovarius]|uniref:DUF1365 domain-containing protein n=1 Tax=unclassified Roseovarius TaxID=2614913 RepID=UPI00273E7319|nr:MULTISPECIES: DUF1365 domain-containing protein [unclassified Roseovarius]
MTSWPEHIAGSTTHARRGGIGNAFTYGVDYVLIDPEEDAGPMLFSRNRFNLTAVHDRNHGGPTGAGRGLDWARQVFDRAGLPARCRVMLLTQPSFAGYIFNPVSFWMAFDGADLRAVIAEVNNPWGDRHSYLCHLPEFAPIARGDSMSAKKLMHVSPFQDVAGDYQFNFDITPEKIAIRIGFKNGSDGVIATLTGKRKPLSNRSILGALIRRPTGALRTITLIHWQALRLKLKGADYRSRPTPPEHEVS